MYLQEFKMRSLWLGTILFSPGKKHLVADTHLYQKKITNIEFDRPQVEDFLGHLKLSIV